MTISIRNLLEAGVHFGHQTPRWNPKMKPYIYGARNGIHIIDLQKTVRLFREAYRFLRETVIQGNHVLFVGTKRQAQEVVREEALRCDQFYVHNRWLGGTLTNFRTIKTSIDRLNKMDKMSEDGTYDLLPKKEVLKLEKSRMRLKKNLGGIQQMANLPGAIFIIDPNKERIAVHEALKLNIPVVAVVDTNCDPTSITFPIPGNDDAIRAIRLFASTVADACLEGKALQKEQPVVEMQPVEEKPAEAKPEEGGPDVKIRPHAPRPEEEKSEATGE